MRVLVLGGSGMLGHKLWQEWNSHFNAYVTVRRGLDSFKGYNLFHSDRTIEHVSAEDFDSVEKALALVRPDAVVNCIGIIKQQAAAKDPLPSIVVNSLFPHRLAKLCRQRGSRLIHISTDCVFSGKKGNYDDDDVPDAEDLYGRTKLLGEVAEPGCLTVRTSIIGHELGTAHGLVEWFLSQQGKTVNGYRKAIFSGFTTRALARILARILTEHPELSGLWHVAAEPINKFDLLGLVREVYGAAIEIVPNDTVHINRSLRAERFRRATGMTPPSWRQMIEDMHAEAA